VIEIERIRIENACCLEHSAGTAELVYLPAPPPGDGWFQIEHLSDRRETTWRRITLVQVVP
jgi:hypothetical protein